MTRVFGPESLLADVMDAPAARAVVQRFLPGVANSPLLIQLRHRTLSEITRAGAHARLSPRELDSLWSELARIDTIDHVEGNESVFSPPDPDYEDSKTARGSARVNAAPAHGVCWGMWELVLDGPRHGNPFVDVEFGVHAVRPDGSGCRAGGFYDGNGTWKVRLLPDQPGMWTITTVSTARSLDSISVTIEVGEATTRGPVRVHDTFHFAYADGSPYLPLGTTAYAWTHQSKELQDKTLQSLADSPFTKLRMCVFPKSYLFNTNEPSLYPFTRTSDGMWDFSRFNPEFFRMLEDRIIDLGRLGIEADVILFHAYDRWGFSDMDRTADDHYVEYVVRRLAAFRNVWWSLANEYDLLFSKKLDDWERLAQIVTREDPWNHLISIHNCFGFYDYSRPWITHASVQRIDVYRTAENTDEWRKAWGKPVIIDECAYEGDIDQGWGNITGEEMLRRFWEGAVRGGYVGHGETYLNDREELWWSKGGNLVGSSPRRIDFLARIIAESPTGYLEPLTGDWDTPWGGVESKYRVGYFGFNRPSYRDIMLAADQMWTVDVIDTWNMTITRLPGIYSGSLRVPLPARQYMAIRMMSADS